MLTPWTRGRFIRQFRRRACIHIYINIYFGEMCVFQTYDNDERDKNNSTTWVLLLWTATLHRTSSTRYGAVDGNVREDSRRNNAENGRRYERAAAAEFPGESAVSIGRSVRHVKRCLSVGGCQRCVGTVGSWVEQGGICGGEYSGETNTSGVEGNWQSSASLRARDAPVWKIEEK